jgi:hypothetical protein
VVLGRGPATAERFIQLNGSDGAVGLGGIKTLLDRENRVVSGSWWKKKKGVIIERVE